MEGTIFLIILNILCMLFLEINAQNNIIHKYIRWFIHKVYEVY